MSTSTDIHNLPDAAVLERLANQFFAALPGTQFNPGIQPEQPAQPPAYKDQLLEQGSVADVKQAPTSLPDPHFAGKGQVPASVAGSGISPSAKSAAGAVNKIDPSPEYLSKPYQFAGSAPHKTENISALPHSLSNLPYADEQPFEQSLRGVLDSIHTFPVAPQLPVTPGGALNQSSFYFLPGKEYLHPAMETAGTAASVSRSNQSISGIAAPPFDVNQVRADFPILKTIVNGRRLIWLDNAATTQKPWQVIDRLSYFYQHENSNIHRAAHELAARATDAYEEARKKVQVFLKRGLAQRNYICAGNHGGH